MPATWSLPLLALLLLSADSSYGRERQFEGIYTSGFEHSEFDGCWLNFSELAARQLDKLAVFDKYEVARYAVRFVGQTTPRIRNLKRGQGYGHLGMMPCEIKASRILSIRKVD